MAPYIISRLLWSVVLLFVVSFITFVIFYPAAVGRPGAAARRPQPEPELVAAIRENLGLDKPGTCSTAIYMRGPRLPLRLRLQLPEQRRGPRADLRPPAGHVVARLRRRCSSGSLSASRSASSPRSSAARWSTARDGRRAAWRSPRPSTGSAWSRSTCSRGHRAVFPIFKGAGTYAPIHRRTPSQWFPSLLLPWLVLAASFAAIYARFLRANLIEVLGEDYIRTARAKGLARAPRRLQPRRALARSRRS